MTIIISYPMAAEDHQKQEAMAIITNWNASPDILEVYMKVSSPEQQFAQRPSGL